MMKSFRILFFVAALSVQAEPLAAQQNSASIPNDQHLSIASKILAGPQLNGEEYAHLRPQSTFNVVQFNVTRSDSEDPELIVTLGPDFVIEINSFGQTTFYDFRYRRILQFYDEADYFTNDSLFGHWFTRWAFLSNNLQTMAMLGAVGVFKDTEIERYWIEQRNGVDYPQAVAFRSMKKPNLRGDMNGETASYLVGENLVARATFSNLKFPNTDYIRTFTAWLIWSQYLHPSLAQMLGEKKYLPSNLQVVAKLESGPPDSKPQSITLSFNNQMHGRVALDVLGHRSPTRPSWEPRFTRPLGEIMLEAARGEAPNGPISETDYMAQVTTLIDIGKKFDAALLAIHASMGCTDAPKELEFCNFMSSALSQVFSDSNVIKLSEALNLDQDGQHTKAATAMIALRELEPQREDILNIMIANSIVEAKNKGQLDNSLQKEFDSLPILFENAFRKDPYVPSRYRDFYNYLHASTATTEDAYLVYVKAYPVIDLARSIPERPVTSIVQSVSDVESRIANDFEAHFPVFD